MKRRYPALHQCSVTQKGKKNSEKTKNWKKTDY